MSWEQEITQKIQEMQSKAVRYDKPQELSNEQKQTAKTNISLAGATAEQISGNNYRIIFS